MNKELEKQAKAIFKETDVDKIYVNPNGHFFTSENFANNSVKEIKDIKTIYREDLVSKKSKTDKNASTSNNTGNKKPSSKKLIVKAADNSKICFINLVEGDTYKVGDKAKIGRKNADGIIKINPQSSLEFDKGVLTNIIKS